MHASLFWDSPRELEKKQRKKEASFLWRYSQKKDAVVKTGRKYHGLFGVQEEVRDRNGKTKWVKAESPSLLKGTFHL